MTTPPPNPTPSANPPPGGWRPWRSPVLGWAVAGAALVIGVPLFLRMPPWCDVTLYDIAARTLLRGGVHYRDVFDTNLPGFVWAVAAVRSVFGWSAEALRVADLVLVGLAGLVLARWMRRAGGTAASAAWFAAAAALFYPFTSEFNHCQRDVWMLLPAAVAAWLRVRQVGRAERGPVPLVSVAEGFLWGLAVWLKPHVVVPAATVWLVSLFLLSCRWSRRTVVLDLAALVCGGLLAAAPGVAWLVGSGAWPYFHDVLTNWNPEYVSQAWAELPDRVPHTFAYFPPWSLLHLAALPVAGHALWQAGEQPARSGPAARALLAGLYLGWMAQALLLQKGLDYVHVPETLLGMALLASRGWAVGLPFAVWFLVVGIGLNLLGPESRPSVRAFNRSAPAFALQKHAMVDPEVLDLWPRCWRGGSPELRDRLGHYVDVHCGTRWEELHAVAGYLRTVDPPLRDRELTCFHDSTHPLYLMLDLEPSTRYMHFGTVLSLRRHVDEIGADVERSRQRYVVSDLRRMTWDPRRAYEPGAGGRPDRLPAWIPKSQRDVFPWNQPVVFRSGRYVVHHVVHPVGRVDIPPFDDLDRLGPGE